ncbi:MAG: hypothetical protein H6891_13695 [Brucellaceae bacterium]|nr:hypothetical protein [Brucellaceae bacterium]
MATLTIRNVPEDVKRALRTRAAEHGVSMEEEARKILSEAAQVEQPARQLLAEDLLAFVRNAPKGEPLDPRYATLSQKELTDLVSEGLL